MKIRGLRLVLLGILGIATIAACRSEFEKVRLSNDPQKILEKAHEYYDEEEYLKAQTLYELVLNQFRGTSEAEKMFFRYAYSFYHLRQYRLAAHYFRNFANTFAYSDYKQEAEYMVAYSYYQLSPVFRLDQTETREAIQAFQEFVNTYPESERVEECNALIDEMRGKLERKAFANGVQYYGEKSYQAAIHTFENMLEEYPDTDRAERVRYLIVKSAYEYANNSVYNRKAERFELVQSKYTDFIRKHPESMYVDEVQSIYEDSQEQLKNLEQ